jgi:hypothetical protein
MRRPSANAIRFITPRKHNVARFHTRHGVALSECSGPDRLSIGCRPESAYYLAEFMTE